MLLQEGSNKQLVAKCLNHTAVSYGSMVLQGSLEHAAQKKITHFETNKNAQKELVFTFKIHD